MSQVYPIHCKPRQGVVQGHWVWRLGILCALSPLLLTGSACTTRPPKTFGQPFPAAPKPYVNASAPVSDWEDLWSPFGTPRRTWSLRDEAPEWRHLDRSALNIQSASAMVVDERGNVLYAKNPRVVRPIASVTKLMTAMVVLDTGVPLDTPIRITVEDLDRLKNSRSRLRVNETVLSRRELIMVALMSSDNRAAHALGRTTFRGGTPEFIRAMNRKAQALGMSNTQFVDASGLDPRNRSTAEDLVKMVRAAANYPLIRETTARPEMSLRPFADGTILHYRNTNPLVRSPDWTVEVSKTGFINEAGRCLAMQVRIGDRRFYMVFLGGTGHLTPMGDSKRVRDWLLTSSRLAAAP